MLTWGVTLLRVGFTNYGVVLQSFSRPSLSMDQISHSQSTAKSRVCPRTMVSQASRRCSRGEGLLRLNNKSMLSISPFTALPLSHYDYLRVLCNLHQRPIVFKYSICSHSLLFPGSVIPIFWGFNLGSADYSQTVFEETFGEEWDFFIYGRSPSCCTGNSGQTAKVIVTFAVYSDVCKCISWN